MGRSVYCSLILFRAVGAGEELVETRSSNFIEAYSENRIAPKFQNGRLISWRFETAAADQNVFIYSKTGELIGSRALGPSGALKVRLHDVAVDASGAIAGVGQAVDSEGRLAQFLAIVPNAQSAVSIHRLNPLVGNRVAFASDSTVWLLVSRSDEGGGEDASQGDYEVVRHYSSTGSLLGEMVPRSSLHGLFPISGGTGGNDRTFLAANGERIGVYLGTSGRWMEWKTGKLTECSFSVPLRAGQAPIALSDVVVPARGGPIALFEHMAGFGLYQLDCERGSWTVLSLFGSGDRQSVTNLLGIDGSEMVFRGWRAADATVLWAPIPGAAAESLK